MQWTDFSNLTNAQRTKLAEFATIGTSLGGATPNLNPDISGVTYSQAKQVLAFAREAHTLVGPAVVGANYVMKKAQEQAVKDFDTANP
jgi:hypothetical protein